MATIVEPTIGGAICRFQTRSYDHTLIMMSFTLRQLDRTRQPGTTRLGATWYAPMSGAASPAGVIDVTSVELGSVGRRDSRRQSIVGAVTVCGGTRP